MRERITNDSVAYFVNTLVPLSQRLFDRKIKATEGGRAAEAKVWEVVIGQIWDCLPGFLDLARDLREVSGLAEPVRVIIADSSLLLCFSNVLGIHSTFRPASFAAAVHPAVTSTSYPPSSQHACYLDADAVKLWCYVGRAPGQLWC